MIKALTKQLDARLPFSRTTLLTAFVVLGLHR
jgi:hypothetical protein